MYKHSSSSLLYALAYSFLNYKFCISTFVVIADDDEAEIAN